ncbi:MAG: gamma-glutamylcyclotransferase family protein [Atribacterota bacterium]
MYGTLMKKAHSAMSLFLEKFAEYVDEATFQGKLYDLGSYPGAIVSYDSADAVRGEVFRLKNPERSLPVLDQYEGCPKLYIRQKAEVTLSNRKKMTVWIYLYNCSVKETSYIPSGSYEKYLEKLYQN